MSVSARRFKSNIIINAFQVLSSFLCLDSSHRIALSIESRILLMAEADAGDRVDAPINSAVGKKYWEGVEADVNAMLGGVPMVGGFSYVSKVDLQGSRSFLAKLGIGNKNGRRRVAAALEGGAGFVHMTSRQSMIAGEDTNLPYGA
jgi:hypothetical protein